MSEVGGGEGGVVSVGPLVIVAVLVAVAFVVAGLRLLGGFLGLCLWLSCILGACAKSVWICLLEDKNVFLSLDLFMTRQVFITHCLARRRDSLWHD